MAFKQCPVCTQGMLGFIAHPTIQDDEVIAVIATCNSCRYSFFHHLRFDQMLTEVVITVEADDEVDEKQPLRFRHPRLVKSGARLQ